MATLQAQIFKHHKKTDGTFNVKICVYHREERVFIDTEHYVTDRQLDKEFKIKDKFILSILTQQLDLYRKNVSELGSKLEYLNAESLKDYLLRKDQKVDFLKFCQIHLDQMAADGRTKSMSNYKTVRNSVVDFLGNKQTLPVELITLDFISKYERFLRSKRKMIRTDRLGREYEMEGKPLPDSSVHIYLRDFQRFFSAAMTYYSKPSLGLNPIPYNPFEEYKIVPAPETEKRKLPIGHIITIRDCKVKPLSRAELAQKLSMLSFYLCGMNAIDFFKRNYTRNEGRVEYCRSKTTGRRKDKAFISIKIPLEARELMEFAAELPDRYATIGNLNKALSKGMGKLSELTKLPGLQYYKLRHSFGDLARNTARRSKDDVALALNHVDQGHKTTDIYVAKDWSILDEVQLDVINLLRHWDKKNKNLQELHAIRLFVDIQQPKLSA